MAGATTARAAVSGHRVWARQGPAHTVVFDVAVAPSGGVYVGGGTHPSSTTDRVLLMRLSAGGAHRWTRVLGYGDALALNTDAHGNLYVGADVGKSVGGIGILKLSPAGKLLWMRTWYGRQGKGTVGFPQLVVRPSGVAYLCGTERAGVHTVVRKYTAAGNLAWSWRSPDAGVITGMCQCGMDDDSHGNLYVSTSVKDARLAVCKLSATGKLQWRRTSAAVGMTMTHLAVGGSRVWATDGPFVVPIGSASGLLVSYDLAGTRTSVARGTSAGRLVADTAGNAYLGRVVGTAGSPIPSAATVVKLDRNGAVVWTGSAESSADALTIDKAGRVWAAGSAWISERSHLFVASWDAAGTPRWDVLWTIGTKTTSDEVRGIALAGRGGLYVGGDTLVKDYTAVVGKYVP
jgi:hypothetical protein